MRVISGGVGGKAEGTKQSGHRLADVVDVSRAKFERSIGHGVFPTYLNRLQSAVQLATPYKVALFCNRRTVFAANG